MASRAVFESYPLSPHKCCLVLFFLLGRLTTALSNVGSKSFMSCLFAPLTTRDNGIPRPSTRMLRFVPFFSPIRWVRSNGFNRQRCLHHRSINALPSPGNAFHFIVFGQTLAPKLDKYTLSLPILKILVHRTAASIFTFWYGFPLATSAQYIHYCSKHHTGIHPLPSTTGAPFILAL